jgi:hypothetical protein
VVPHDELLPGARRSTLWRDDELIATVTATDASILAPHPVSMEEAAAAAKGW